MAADSAPQAAEHMESAAFPPLLRALAAASVLGLFVYGLRSLGALRGASWSPSAQVLFALAALCIAWMGYWIVRSRIRLEGDTLTQTWLWRKHAQVQDVAQLKLVHLPGLEALFVPRLLVRHRSGGFTWFQSADARLLRAFAEQTARFDATPKPR